MHQFRLPHPSATWITLLNFGLGPQRFAITRGPRLLARMHDIRGLDPMCVGKELLKFVSQALADKPLPVGVALARKPSPSMRFIERVTTIPFVDRISP